MNMGSWEKVFIICGSSSFTCSSLVLFLLQTCITISSLALSSLTKCVSAEGELIFTEVQDVGLDLTQTLLPSFQVQETKVTLLVQSETM